jgi:effector-binding domain-containing protein
MDLMIDAPKLVHSPQQHVALIRFRIPMREMPTIMGPGISEIYATISEQHLAATGSWFNHVFTQPTDEIDFAICVPIPTAVAATGRVEPSVRRACDVQRTNYTGPYEGLGSAWQAFTEATNGLNHVYTDDFWECYVHGPESTEDSNKFVTELNRPIRA